MPKIFEIHDNTNPIKRNIVSMGCNGNIYQGTNDDKNF